MEKEELKKLLEKYPFLIYRNIFSGEKSFKTEEEDLEHNWYVAWDGCGWEKLWKRFMQEIFKEYDKLPDTAKKGFAIYDTKEKYGTLRVSLSGYTDGMQEAESILHMLSSVTCQHCGKVPRDSKGNHIIWQTGGWISNLCKDCFKKEWNGFEYKAMSKKEKAEYKEYEKQCRVKPKKYFSREIWGQKEGHKKIFYTDNLEKDWLVRAYAYIIEEGKE